MQLDYEYTLFPREKEMIAATPAFRVIIFFLAFFFRVTHDGLSERSFTGLSGRTWAGLFFSLSDYASQYNGKHNTG